jgi:hypothetical protein
MKGRGGGRHPQSLLDWGGLGMGITDKRNVVMIVVVVLSCVISSVSQTGSSEGEGEEERCVVFDGFDCVWRPGDTVSSFLPRSDQGPGQAIIMTKDDYHHYY